MLLPPGLRLEAKDDPTYEQMEALAVRLEAFNESAWPAHQPWRAIALFVWEQQNLVGGIAGETYAGWLFIRYFWIAESLRGQGIGRQLIGEAEARALARGCHSAWVDTFSFQAPGFYQKLGYEVFGELAWSADHKRIFLRKQLRAGGAAQSRPDRLEHTTSAVPLS